jgi:predicted AlkP superfamily phosphohydrolase/phosphomutase
MGGDPDGVEAFVLLRTCAGVLMLSVVLVAFCADRPDELLLMVGLDGACWETIDLLIERGELPSFKRMKQEGAWGPLTCDPPLSPASWTSLATGRSPASHGIEDWGVRVREPAAEGDPCALASYRYIPINASMITAPRFWDVASTAGRRVAVVNWLFTWPAKPLRGFMVADWTAQGRHDRFYPPELEEALGPALEASRRRSAQSQRSHPPRFRERDGEVEAAFRETDRLLAISRHFLERHHDLDLLTVGFYFTNNMAHRYWHYLYPDYYRVPGEEAERYADVIPRFYRMIDSFLAPHLDDASTTVLIFSDHGMTGLRDETAVELSSDVGFRIRWEEILEAMGLLSRRGDRVRWSRTQAYLKSYEDRSGVCINLAGREEHGVVARDDFLSLRSAVADSLRSFRIEETGELLFPAVEEGGCFDIEVKETLSIPWGRHRSLPGATVILNGKQFPFSRFFTWKGRYAAHDEGIMIQGALAGEEGVFLVHGRCVAGGVKLGGASNVDVAPTVLYLLDLPVARDMDGGVLTEAVRPGVLQKRPIDYVENYADLRGTPADEPTVAPEGRAALIERLRALGYLD